MVFVPLAAVSGSVAALGSVLAKYAFAADSAPVEAVRGYCSTLGGTDVVCNYAAWATRAPLIAGLIIINSYALMLSVKGMSQSGSFLASVLNTAANFLTAALLGAVIFKEHLNATWWVGATLIGLGVTLISTANKEAAAQASKSSPVLPRTRRAAAGGATTTTPSAPGGGVHTARRSSSRSRGRKPAPLAGKKKE